MSPKTTLLVMCVLLYLLDVAVSLCGNECQRQLRVNHIQNSNGINSSNISKRKWESTKSLFRVKRSVRRYGKGSWLNAVIRNTPEMDKLFPNRMKDNLLVVGLYLAAHKYFEVDRRYTFSTTKYEDRKFFKHFPIPRLKKLHPTVERECNKGAFECITHIYKTALVSGSLASKKILTEHKNLKKGSIPLEYPFDSALEQFQYRTTASYFMCWYTELGDDLLAFEDEKGCYFNLVGIVQEAVDGKGIYDIRSEILKYEASLKEKRVSPHTCPYLWFCPDPCYGRSTLGNVRPGKYLDDPLNPCSRLKDRACFWETGNNKNFEYLIKNRINYTCNCENERKGFIWSPKYSICIDQDECYNDVANCSSDKICRNTMGSYSCKCRRGFKLNNSTDRCDRHALFRPKSHVGMKGRRNIQQEEDQTGIWATIDRLFGLNSSSKTHYSVLLHTLVTFLCIVLQYIT
ncbi:uncharacterized protein LOC110445635 isoform X1 [Mizuhopecten yessoensis]|uniref:Fibrillin-1 n=1 Tax=Mizuhopecten yessoensis TaxID=6573 RepID=A0A210QZ87_MIZYE|nr:uncharacterized protein LOC110445635 isoform X1 [Mizuhopecten yessoensis]XP_021346017.1 uncharacterized protein LOC110445635 isoform X1 [Mizuhopecten yessoensis]OWF54047.1 Fibrillin-1 [Mizuhopecten yessoensis]